MIVFNQPAVILDMKQSQPKRLLPTSPERFVVSLREKPNRGIYHRKTESTTPRVVGVYSTKFNTRFVVPLLLLHKKKKKTGGREFPLDSEKLLIIVSPQWKAKEEGIRSECGDVCVPAVCKEVAPGWVWFPGSSCKRWTGQGSLLAHL